MREPIFENPLPKIMPLRGSLHVAWKRCGRLNCRCQRGRLHGPFYELRWRDRGHQHKRYVPRDDVPATLLGIELRRAMFPPVYRITEVVKSALPRRDR